MLPHAIPALRLLLLVTLLSRSSLCFADLFEDQMNLLKGQKEKAIVEVNRKYTDSLAVLLEKVKANKDEAMAIKIRQEMFDVGFPHKDDWILGTWVVSYSDNFKRTYVFAANGSARMTRYEGSMTADVNSGGVYAKEPDGSYRVTFANALLFVSQSPRGGGIVVARWPNGMDYPDKSKMITGTAKR